MQNNTLKIRRCINPTIKVGDQVQLIDGSGLSDEVSKNGDIFITNSYSHLTRSTKPLDQLVGIVDAINLDDQVLPANEIERAYLQDCRIKINGHPFRTCSQFVKKLEYAPACYKVVNSNGNTIGYIGYCASKGVAQRIAFEIFVDYFDVCIDSTVQLPENFVTLLLGQIKHG